MAGMQEERHLDPTRSPLRDISNTVGLRSNGSANEGQGIGRRDLIDLELENVCRDESISNLTNIPSFKDDRQDSQDIINKIEAFIPSNLKFVIKSFRKLTDSGFLLATSPFQAVILINISTSESVSDFIDSYCSTIKETLRCSKSKSQVDPQDVSNNQFIFKKAFRCHHNTRTTKTKWKPDKRSKNTECPFVLTIKIHNSSYKKRRPAENNFDPNFPCEVHFSYDHNHKTQILQALTFRDVSQSSKDVYLHLFKDSKTPKPSMAQAQFKKLLRNNTESAEDYEINFADRQQKPGLSDVQRLYESFNSSVYGGRNGESLVKKMSKKEEEYNTKYSGEGGVMKHIIENADDDKKGNFILAIALVTPLMARSHTMIRSSGEQVFIDSTSNLEELNLRLFLLCTHSPAGGLPLGVIITSDETQATLEMAFSLLKDCLPENSFYGRGKDLGPISFLSDNNDEERKALNAVWPDSVRLLCVFHLLQAIWRWLMDKQNGISSAERPKAIKELRHIVHAESQESLEEAYENFVSGELGEKYNNLLLYFDQFVWKNKECWAKFYRINLPVRGNNTQNYVEAQFRVIKDEIVNRVRCFNFIELIDKITEDLESHYKDKLLTVSNGSFDGIFSKKYLKPLNHEDIKPDQISVISEESQIFAVVPSGKGRRQDNDLEPYIVDASAGFCDCPKGRDGTFCKHQYAVLHKYQMTSPNAFPVFSAHERRKYAQVALGCCLDLKYYLGLQEKLADAEQFEQERSQDISNECPDLEVKLNNDTVNQLSVLPEITTPNITKAEAVYATASICQKLNELIGTNDQQVLSGILKMNSRLQKMSNSQVTSALQCFGSQFTYVKSSQLSAKARLSKARHVQHSRIHVQPEASKRRKENSCKTKQALPKGKTASISYVLPEKSNYLRKRRHCFSENVNAIVAVSKKLGRSMSSKTMPVRKPKVKKESY